MGTYIINMAEPVTITIANGHIKDSSFTTIDEKNKYYAFKGIRYAEPPKRFEESVPVKNWDGTYDATEDKSVCIQTIPSMPFLHKLISRIMERQNSSILSSSTLDVIRSISTFFSKANESEDCLYINVYTPKLPTIRNESIPVMFWIYGGAFIGGDSHYTKFGPDYLLNNNVVVVTINYRVNVFGFLSTGDKRIPGNNGIKDIILGLKWVQKNIRYFGGDPNKVTIFGESAGAALVSYLLLSPLTIGKGYFHKAIAQSGSSLSKWSFQKDPVTTYNKIIKQLKCKSFFPWRNELSCLKNIPLLQIRLAAISIVVDETVFKLHLLNGIDFAPVYEDPSPTAAITNLAYETLAKQQIPQIPILTGITSEEGLVLTQAFSYLELILTAIDLHPERLANNMYAPADDINKFIAPKVKEYYFNNASVIDSKPNFLRYISDTQFNKPFRQFLTLVANHTTQYCYVFSYSGALNKLPNSEGLGQVGHGGELKYLFSTETHQYYNITEQDRMVIKRLTKLWTNFAKYGNPTPSNNDSTLQSIKWPTAWLGGTNVNCLDIGKDLKIVRNPKEDGYQLWKKLYDTYGRPRDTY